jgi:hypothetical protein
MVAVVLLPVLSQIRCYHQRRHQLEVVACSVVVVSVLVVLVVLVLLVDRQSFPQRQRKHQRKSHRHRRSGGMKVMMCGSS